MASIFLVPLIVARWWVLLALVGPAISLTIMQLAGFTVHLDDSTGPAWNYRTAVELGMVAFVMGVVLAVRVSFDVRREERDQSDQPG